MCCGRDATAAKVLPSMCFVYENKDCFLSRMKTGEDVVVSAY
jgi:hypothetical protein